MTADGSIGPVTLAAVRAARAEAQMAHYRTLPHCDAFGRGWTARTDAARAAALAEVAGGEERRAA